ncbi:MAG: hypothetical protein HUK24_06795, partial [Sphaerochaetaceae bacterium]|nr:hypothetical protein [Sphaerochaetaceae bacterium]
ETKDAFFSLVEENLNIVLPKGDFYLNKTVLFDTLSIGHDDGCGENTKKRAHLVIKGLKNLTIKGANDENGKPVTRLFGYNDMEQQTLKPSILWAEDCPNLKLEDIEFALSKYSSFIGTVIEKTDDYIVVQPQKDDYPNDITPYCMNAFRNGVLVGQSLTIGFDVKESFQRLDDGNYKLLSKSIAQKVTINDELSWHLSGLTDFLVFIGNCDNLELNNIRISDACGFGMLTEACENINANKVVIKSNDGYQPVSRDGWKIYRCSGKVQVTDSWIEGTRMDGQNVHGNYLLVKGINGNKLYLELRYAPTPLKVGSELRFYKDDEIGKGTILSCEVINSDYRDIEQQGDNTAARAVVGKKNRFNTYCVELDEIPTGVDEDTFVVADVFTVQEYICKNTVFRNIAGCGNLVRSRTAVLDNNRYENIMNAGILVGSEWDTHLESTNPEKTTICNCSFKNIGFVPR